jgi:hypothetical protein
VTIDYSSFLEVDEKGCIWWPVEDAINLVAGYLPVRQNDRKGTLTLIAPDREVAHTPELIWSEFWQSRRNLARPRVVEDSYGHIVEARSFVSWLVEYVANQPKPKPMTFEFFVTWLIGHVGYGPVPNELPDELFAAMGDLLDSSLPQIPLWTTVGSLQAALEGWFDKGLSALPSEVNERVKLDLPQWENLSADQRRNQAAQWDYLHDPARVNERKARRNLLVRQDRAMKQIKKWQATATPTVDDLLQRKIRLLELHLELAMIERDEIQGRPSLGLLQPQARSASVSGLAPDYCTDKCLPSADAGRSLASQADQTNTENSYIHGGNGSSRNITASIEPEIGSAAWRVQRARNAANSRHERPGGSRDKAKRIREAWASGKYSSRDLCAEQECAAQAMSFSSARKALVNTPDP